eukprot:TRINITY_DN3926_c0_g1_i3.p1 TRINITY_DN3926_c0_g1~~TRINITY_DN3926_c0_g1_i3.p1  ORF type:complete len:104 (+),score=17.18 TRINITY_DN3926_c0_g1_i3:97-408(+)
MQASKSGLSLVGRLCRASAVPKQAGQRRKIHTSRATRDAAAGPVAAAMITPELANYSGKTEKLNLFMSINNAMSIALEKDPKAVVFGEDVAFGGGCREASGLR